MDQLKIRQSAQRGRLTRIANAVNEMDLETANLSVLRDYHKRVVAVRDRRADIVDEMLRQPDVNADEMAGRESIFKDQFDDLSRKLKEAIGFKENQIVMKAKSDEIRQAKRSSWDRLRSRVAVIEKSMKLYESLKNNAIDNELDKAVYEAILEDVDTLVQEYGRTMKSLQDNVEENEAGQLKEKLSAFQVKYVKLRGWLRKKVGAPASQSPLKHLSQPAMRRKMRKSAMEKPRLPGWRLDEAHKCDKISMLAMNESEEDEKFQYMVSLMKIPGDKREETKQTEMSDWGCFEKSNADQHGSCMSSEPAQQEPTKVQCMEAEGFKLEEENENDIDGVADGRQLFTHLRDVCLESQGIDEKVDEACQNEEFKSSCRVYNAEERYCEQNFVENTTKADDEKLTIKMPFKEGFEKLGSNGGNAMRQPYAQEDCRKKDETLDKRYVEARTDFIDSEHMEKLTSKHSWRHVEGKCNPVDVLSRGCLQETLPNCTSWLEGAAFFKLPKEQWPTSKVLVNNDDRKVLKEMTKKAASAMVTNICPDKLLTLIETRFSRLHKLLNTVAYVKSFAHNTRTTPRSTGELSHEELGNAEKTIIQVVQRSCYREEMNILHQANVNTGGTAATHVEVDGIMRIGGKIQNDLDLPYEDRHPISSPPDLSAKLMIQPMHEDKWIHLQPDWLWKYRKKIITKMIS